MFAAAVTAMSWASVQLTAALERIGARLHFSEGLLGIVTALGADAPEISSAFAALYAGRHDLGLGVVLGSNIFNFAGLLGLSALVAGEIEIGTQGLWLNGGVALAVSGIVLALLLRWLSVAISVALLLALLTPYVIATTLHPPQIERLPLPRSVRGFLAVAIGHVHRDSAKRPASARPGLSDVARLALAALGVVFASAFAVHCAAELGVRWHVSGVVIGVLVLAAVTSVPNVATTVRLAREGRGAAVVSESLNSNTLNVLAGVGAPALLIGFAPPTPLIAFTAVWLFGMNVVALAAASRHGGLHWRGGALLIGLYAIFAAVVVTKD